MRKLLSVITAAAACVLLCSAAIYADTVKAAAAAIVDGAEEDPTTLLWLNELDNGEAEVYLIAGKESGLTSIVIPEEIDGLKVVGLADMAFWNCDELLSITIPDTLRYIGSKSFEGCTSLETVVFPKNLTEIGSNAFSGCEALTVISLPDKLETIGSYAFYGCTSLMSITIPDSVASIDEGAFLGCSRLAEVNMPDVIENIGARSFENTPFWNDQTGVKYGGKMAIGCDDNIEDAVIKPGTLVIGAYSFSGSQIVSVTVPESIEYIGNNAFEWCRNLTTVNMPDKIVKIGASAFNDTPFYGDQEDDVKYVGKMAVVCDWSAESVRIKPGTLSICDNAFDGCSRLESIVIPDSIIEIGDFAFQDTWALKSVTIPESVKKIGSGIFKNSVVESVTILGSIDNIPDEAFNLCDRLEKLYLPASVKSVGSEAFAYCRALSVICFAGTEEEWKSIVINDENSELLNAEIHYNSPVPAPDLIQIPIDPNNASMIDMILTFTYSDGENVVLSIDENGMLDLSQVADGDYSFTFSAKNCAARSYDVTLDDGELTGLGDGVELHLYGDIDGDGEIDVSEVAKANAYAKGNEDMLSDYALSICDVNRDGVINIQDVAKMNAHLTQTVMLW